MSTVRSVGAVLLVSATVLAASCSGGSDKSTETSRPAVRFQTPKTGAATMPLCVAFKPDKVKKVLGGGANFRVLPPEAIGQKGDPVTGQTCDWERRGPGNKSRSLQIEGRDYGSDQTGVTAAFDQARQATTGTQKITDLGDAAFSSSSGQAVLLQVVRGPILLSLSSRGDGGLDPLSLDELKALAMTAMAKVA